MKALSTILVFTLCLFILTGSTYAMWAKLTDSQLIDSSDVIIVAELTDIKDMTVQNEKKTIGLLETEEVLKGDKQQSVFLLELPSKAIPLKSDDIFYQKGEKGLWYLRQRGSVKDDDIYIADHPQRFLPSIDVDDELNYLRTYFSDNPE